MMTDKAYEMFSDYEDVVTVDDVMKMLHIGKNSVYDLLKNHRIESIKVGSSARSPPNRLPAGDDKNSSTVP